MSVPVLVLSSPRSGSTLLRLLLDTHEDLSCPGELGLGALARHLACVVDSLGGEEGPAPSDADPAVAAWRERRRFRLWPAWQRWPLPFSRASSVGQVRALLTELIDAHLSRVGASIFCERTPENTEELDVLGAVFPEAKYVCLHRHGFDVTYSLVERNQFGIPPDYALFSATDPTNFVAGALGYWVSTTRTLLDLEARLGARCHRVRYEDLVEDPAPVLARLCAFLGVPEDPSIPRRVFTAAHHDGVGDFKAPLSRELDPTRIGKGTRIPRDRVPTSLLQEANTLLAELGYPEVSSTWNQGDGWRAPAAPARPSTELLRPVDDHAELDAALLRALDDLRRRDVKLSGTVLLELRHEGGTTHLLVDGARCSLEAVTTVIPSDTHVSMPRELLLRAIRKEADLLEANNLAQVSVSGEVQIAMTLLHAALAPT